MAYSLTPEQVASITDVEVAFATTRLLPAWEDIPEEFRRGNQYTAICEALFYGDELPDMEMTINPGFDEGKLVCAVLAHLGSFGPKHEHKIAGVGLLLASACTLSAPVAGSAPAG